MLQYSATRQGGPLLSCDSDCSSKAKQPVRHTAPEQQACGHLAHRQRLQPPVRHGLLLQPGRAGIACAPRQARAGRPAAAAAATRVATEAGAGTPAAPQLPSFPACSDRPAPTSRLEAARFIVKCSGCALCSLSPATGSPKVRRRWAPTSSTMKPTGARTRRRGNPSTPRTTPAMDGSHGRSCVARGTGGRCLGSSEWRRRRRRRRRRARALSGSADRVTATRTDACRWCLYAAAAWAPLLTGREPSGAERLRADGFAGSPAARCNDGRAAVSSAEPSRPTLGC